MRPAIRPPAGALPPASLSMRALLLLAAIVLASAPAPATPVPCAGAACPDLAVDPLERSAPQLHETTFAPTHCAVAEGLVAPGARTLLRFPLAVANVGAGPLALGAPPTRPEWFEMSPCHGHYHFSGFAEYRLWTPAAYAQWTLVRAQAPERPAADLLAESPHLAAGLAAGHKQGFCVRDARAYAPGLPAAFPTCGDQGLSPGYVDLYDAWLDGQWIDVTGLPAGWYVLETEANPQRRIQESAYGNNAAAQTVWIG